mmetsp:Transcript_24694/g.38802  ORF Transcript_24694/g.38802 Transcript_24694/m.38802 type:complete len:92 (+) Transcript_24694:596-871(+)
MLASNKCFTLLQIKALGGIIPWMLRSMRFSCSEASCGWCLCNQWVCWVLNGARNRKLFAFSWGSQSLPETKAQPSYEDFPHSRHPVILTLH